MRIGYLVNQYPSPTHTFIRREIRALEELGQEVRRYSVRRWPGPLVEAADREEAEKTRVVLEAGALGLLTALLVVIATRPVCAWRALRLAWRAGRASERGVLIHGVYLAEAAVLCRWLKADGVGHVHAHFGTNSTTVAMLCQELGGPTYSFTVHGPEEFDKPEAISLGEKIRRARFVVAISSFCRSQLYRWVGVEHWPKIHIVHCALDDDYFDIPSEAPERTTRLVSIGRLAEQKGQLLLVEAVARMRTRGMDVQVLLIGDGPFRAAIEQRLDALGIADLFELAGWLDAAQIRQHLMTARALILPSFAEGLPVVIMEAMALRCPVLTTRIAGIPELVIDGETGWLMNPGDIQHITSAIDDLTHNDDARIDRITAAAAGRVRQRHSAATEAAKLLGLLNGDPPRIPSYARPHFAAS